MPWKKVRAIERIRHDGIDRIPGQADGKNGQDFVVRDAQATKLFDQGFVSILGDAEEPRVEVPMLMSKGVETGGDPKPSGQSWAAVRNSNPSEATVVLFGHSLMAQNNASGAGANGGVYNNVQGFWSWMQFLSGRRFRLVRNAGIAGNYLQQMIDRYATDVTPYPSKRLIFWGCINDLAAGATLKEITDKLTVIFDLAYSEGRHVQCCLEHFPSVGKEFSDAINRVAMGLQRWMREQAKKRSNFSIIPVPDLICNLTTAKTSMPNVNTLDEAFAGFHINGCAGQIIASDALSRESGAFSPTFLAGSAADKYVDDSSMTLLDNGLFQCANPAAPAGSGTGANNVNVPWAAGLSVTVGKYYVWGGRVYQVTVGGDFDASAGNAPTHVAGTAANGTATLAYVPLPAGAVLGVADGWTVKRAAGNGNCLALVMAAANGIGNQQRVVVGGERTANAVYSLEPTNSLTARFRNGRQYTTRARLAVSDAQHIHTVMARTIVTIDNGTPLQWRDMSPEAQNTDPLRNGWNFSGVFETPCEGTAGLVPAAGTVTAGACGLLIYCPSVPAGTAPFNTGDYVTTPWAKGTFDFSQVSLDRVA